MSKMVAVVDYGMGNVRSVLNALAFVGIKASLIDKPSDLQRADAVIIPGQGAFRDCIKCLQEKKFVTALNEQVMKLKKPYLGICLGMQILGEKSFEGGEFAGLGWVKGVVKKIQPKQNLKVPHLGWNEVKVKLQVGLFKNIPNGACFYFAHSFVLYPGDPGMTVATTDYGGKFPVALVQDNVMAVQFHPEKSQQEGLQLLRNFGEMI